MRKTIPKKIQTGTKGPRILLIGVGRFGEKHLQTLKILERKGKLSISGAVVKTSESQKRISAKYHIPVWKKLSDEILESADAVIIATPPETHFKVAMRCIPFVHILMEKPMTMTEKEAKRLEKCVHMHKKVFMVGHIYRFHPVVKKLKSLLSPLKKETVLITGNFINPEKSDVGRSVSMELPHLFDITDFIFNLMPTIISTTVSKRIHTVNMKYPQNKHAIFKLGWEGNQKIRTIDFLVYKKEIRCDLVENTITTYNLKNGKTETINCPVKRTLLEEELDTFIALIKGKGRDYPDVKIGTRLVQIAEKAGIIQNKSGNTIKNQKRPKVAVIGGGIFGTSTALELGAFCDVTLFEKNTELMKEGSYINCLRHHHGYHYPRSDETVRDILRSHSDFEKIFEDAIDRITPTYYAVARKDSHVSVREFVVFCKRNNLSYEKIFPADNLLSRKEIGLCAKVPEPSYNYAKLKDIAEKKLGDMAHIKVLRNTEVIGSALEKDGQKILTYKHKREPKKDEKFDFIVNATYANINRFADWLDFKHRAIRIDRAELLIIKLPIKSISLTVIDGPFATLMPTGNSNEFSLYHVKESILDRYVPEDGLANKPPEKNSNKEAILKESLRFFPVLKDAIVVESRVVNRGVQAYHEHDDSRVVDLIEHGFGCWSILSGKIVSCVTTAKDIASRIKTQYDDRK